MKKPKGLAIHADLHDVFLADDGNIAVAEGGDAIGQHIRQRLMFWNGEWFLDLSAGVEWTRYVLGRPPSELQIAEAVIKREILDTPDVAEIIEMDVSYDRSSRGCRVNSCTVVTALDDTLELQA